MAWFPADRSKGDGWKFDIVSLIAIIGESTIERHIQLITASRFSWIPRLIPAPQVLLKTKRPERLPPVKDIEIFGVHSGTKVTELNFFADVIHRIRELKPYEFRRYTIEKRKSPANGSITGQNGNVNGGTGGGQVNDGDAGQGLGRAEEGRINMCAEHNETHHANNTAPSEIVIKNPFQWNLLTIVTTVSILMTIGLFIWAALIHDGVAMIAIGTMSMSTCISCMANKWYPTLSPRPTSNEVPPGDVVIKTRKGAFIVAHCNEEVTRELYTCADTCQYTFDDGALQSMLGISTFLLIASIIFFTNCGWTMQTAIGMAYIILNMMYWVIPFVMGDDDKTWDLSLYQQNHDEKKDRILKPGQTYTQALWYAIHETRSVDWVTSGGFAPGTGFWGEWLDLASKNLENEHWDAVGEKDRLMRKANEESRRRTTHN